MRTLLIDNYDSFTFNLYQYLAELTGEPPTVLLNDQVTELDLQSDAFDNIVISPGPGRPDSPPDFGDCSALIRGANCPVLGVCLGHQGIAVAFGGEVIHAPEPYHGRLSSITHNGSELFQGIPREFQAVRYHSLVVRTPLPPELVPTAWTAEGLLMGLRHVTRPIWGVQFHPESIATEYGVELLRNFLRMSLGPSVKLRPQVPAKPKQVHPQPSGAVSWREAPIADPEAVFHSLYANRPNSFWLDGGRFSYMGVASERLDLRTGNVFETLQQRLEATRINEPLPFEFCGGYIGYLGYELKAECGATARHRSTLPDATLLRVDRFLAFDEAERRLYLVCESEPEWLRQTAELLQRLEQKPVSQPETLVSPKGSYLARPREQYLRDIERCLRAIYDGESYELCLTNKLYLEASPDPWTFYCHLRRVNPAPHSAFLRFSNWAIACSSPECFLRIGADGCVESRPIKGTAPRSIEAGALAASVKDRAENLMIVDLLRNDLGRVCEPGTISVPEMMEVESYATVHQLVSTIRGHLRTNCSAVDCVRAAFPPGSMTGAPKLRTMEILDTLESEARGIYSGALGYFSLNGAANLNVVIRTAVLTAGQVEIGAGGAVVALSDPEAEFDEMRLKAESVAQVFRNPTAQQR